MKKLLTIGVPVFNVERFFEECIKSLIDISLCEKYQIFLFDDYGTDNSIEIAKKYKNLYPELIQILSVGRNIGQSSARNYIIEHTSTDYIMFVDSDDYLSDGSIKKIISQLELDSPDILIYDHIRKYDSREELVKLKLYDYGNIQTQNKLDLFINEVPIIACAKAYKLELLNSYRFRHRIPYEDLALIPAIICTAKSILYCDAQYFYRQNVSGSIMATNINDVQKRVIAFAELKINLNDEHRNVFTFLMVRNLIYVLKKFKRDNNKTQFTNYIIKALPLLNYTDPKWIKRDFVLKLVGENNFKTKVKLVLMKHFYNRKIANRLFFKYFF